MAPYVLVCDDVPSLTTLINKNMEFPKRDQNTFKNQNLSPIPMFLDRHHSEEPNYKDKIAKGLQMFKLRKNSNDGASFFSKISEL